jgi:hypothetical protein
MVLLVANMSDGEDVLKRHGAMLVSFDDEYDYRTIIALVLS